MSIRLRLTLVYSSILALTLIIFGFALYSIQSGDTMNALRQDLILSSDRITEATLRTDTTPPSGDAPNREPPPPRPFNEFSSDQTFQELREREIVRILDAHGNLIASPFGREEDALPLSEEGLAALQNQEDWFESQPVSGESMLIYSRPIVQNGQTTAIVQVARSLTERNRTLRSLVTTLTGAGLLTIAVAYGVGWALSGLTLQPIQRITQTAKTIGDERDFSRRVEHQGPNDEVGQLAHTFNQMLERLHNAYQKLERSLELQRNFVADVSHELRTPLTTLRGNLGLMQRNLSAPSEEQTDILADMVDESDRMIRLINDLLRLATADAQPDLAIEPLSLKPLLEESARQAQLFDAKRKITLQCPEEASIDADRDAFKQVMLILLDNALKHSQGAVELQVDLDDPKVEIRVKDQGPGIPEDELDQIFDRFHRGEAAALTPGFGLGLPIAKRLVESMGGKIAIESIMSQGSVVILRFPAAE